ncbi:M24 family metallopeptidase [Halocatena pleomorpha]|uniref:Aminopeptidase P family protein n=1 Tax=Halocatena pleomorpha TaxID=1785090 RepID=A0A3P3RLE1_9EURY|nr:Xaa-Pro peptidase family protein [Halocatena pleomorpha]RRJ33639.1 aminopeptidase P family protein [Halocatena pleomorpha]
MQPDTSDLDRFLTDRNDDGYLIDADGEFPDQRYLSGFSAPDPFVTVYADGVHMLVSSLEYGRAKRESNAETVARYSDFDYRKKRGQYGQTEAKNRVIAAFLKRHGVTSVSVPERFPLSSADGLRDLGISVTVDTESMITQLRAVKTDEEIERIRTAQRANEAAMGRAEALIREATIESDVLVHDGEVLTSERLRREIEMELLRNDHALDETIVACGADAADPHDRGSGPLAPHESIIIDIFPRGKESKYFADMTRTFVKGTPSETIQEWYDLTHTAQQAAFDVIEAGVSGGDVHTAVCDVYEAAGEPTLRSDESTETGFIHSTGHGIGLDVHEQPRLAPGGEQLEVGHIVTVEPGLYDPAVGGVRIEDFGVVTEDGFENFTEYPKQLVVE